MNDGTANVSGPRETVSVIEDPYGVFVASLGSTEMTWSRAMSLEYSVWTTATNPAARSACSAACWLLPTTAGTGTGACPLLTHRSTAEPFGALPSAGACPTTEPSGIVSSEIGFTRPRARPWSWRAVVALSSVIPVRSGTRTGGGPSDGTRVTVEPSRRLVPAAGSTPSTVPFGSAL